MASLGKRRANDADLDDLSNTTVKKHHGSSTSQAVTTAAVAAEQPAQLWHLPHAAGQQTQAQQQGFGFGQQFDSAAQIHVRQTSPSAAAQFQSAVAAGALSPVASPPAAAGAAATASPSVPAAASPAQCMDLVLYQLQQQVLLGALGALSSPIAPLLQQPAQPLATAIQQQQLLQLKQQQQRELGTAHNDHAALKSVWRTLSPAQRRSLTGMWDVIKTEQLLPRLMPNSGLLALPSTAPDEQQQQPQTCIIEEVGEGDQQQQQQHKLVQNGFGSHTSNGFAAAAVEEPAGDMEMQIDDQQLPQLQQGQQPPSGLYLVEPSRAASAEDMEMCEV